MESTWLGALWFSAWTLTDITEICSFCGVWAALLLYKVTRSVPNMKTVQCG